MRSDLLLGNYCSLLFFLPNTSTLESILTCTTTFSPSSVSSVFTALENFPLGFNPSKSRVMPRSGNNLITKKLFVLHGSGLENEGQVKVCIEADNDCTMGQRHQLLWTLLSTQWMYRVILKELLILSFPFSNTSERKCDSCSCDTKKKLWFYDFRRFVCFVNPIVGFSLFCQISLIFFFLLFQFFYLKPVNWQAKRNSQDRSVSDVEEHFSFCVIIILAALTLFFLFFFHWPVFTACTPKVNGSRDAAFLVFVDGWFFLYLFLPFSEDWRD